ncbi:MAG TPA: inorganic phosphate transporter [Nitrospinota bacterium]|nr:inorganic phosphate transporter [Nitrospinota bacterium]
METIILVVAVSFGFYMAWNIGANDAANSMGTSVGSGALTLKQAVIAASVFSFIGAVLLGGDVTNTIRKGMIDPGIFDHAPFSLVYGMLAALIATGLWLQLATYYALPVSTTHSIVGAIIGIGIIVGGFDALNIKKIMQIFASWVVSPVSGGLIAFIVFTFIKKKIIDTRTPLQNVKTHAPYLVFIVFIILTLSLIYKGMKNLHLNIPFEQALLISTGAGILSFLICILLIKKIKNDQKSGFEKEFQSMEKIFGHLQVLTALYVALAFGANDVANAIGPLAGIVSVIQTKTVAMKVGVPIWILALGGVGIAVGICTWGYKVIETTGKKITELTPSRGFSAEFGTATTVLTCSLLGLPVSTTHTLVGSIIGVGFARGIATLNFQVVKNIVLSWIVTLPLTAILSIIIYKILVLLFV